MVGGLRESTSPPKTDYDYGKLQVDDRDWEAVDVPHDFVRSGSERRKKGRRRTNVPCAVLATEALRCDWTV
jgi:hypothetical protein